MYIQDYDERVPTFATDSEMREKLLPYAQNQTLYQCPETAAFYHFNPEISGHRTTEYATPALVETLRDSVLHSDKTITMAFLNGSVKRAKP